MIIDTFLFNKELDILEIRLHELYESVDTFMVIESRKTITNQKKELCFLKNRGRFQKFMKKIDYVIIDDFPQTYPLESLGFYDDMGYRVMVEKNRKIWERELFQRNYALKRLVGCRKDDIVLVGDVDEIPSRNVLLKQRFGNEIYGFEQKMYIGNLNLLCRKHWVGTRAVLYKNLTYPSDVRLSRNYVSVNNGGWHFSSIGNEKSIKNKLNVFTHQDVINEHNSALSSIQFYLDFELNVIETGFPVDMVEIDTSYPEYIRNNLKKFNKYVKKKKRNAANAAEILQFRREIEYLREKVNQLEMEKDMLSYKLRSQQ